MHFSFGPLKHIKKSRAIKLAESGEKRIHSFPDAIMKKPFLQYLDNETSHLPVLLKTAEPIVF